MESRDPTVCVDVVYAHADRQTRRQVRAPAPLSAIDAVRQSGLAQDFPEIDPRNVPLGVFGQPVAHGHLLRDGDRVEIYRPLQMDPREARRRLAERGQTMGQGGDS